jgi:isoamylase
MTRPAALRANGHAVSPGQPWPMGATLTGDGVNFAVFSAHAEMIELCLFTPDGRKEMARLPIRDRDGDIWHLHVGGLTAGRSTAFAPMAPTTRNAATASTRTSCCWTPMPARWRGGCAGRMR